MSLKKLLGLESVLFLLIGAAVGAFFLVQSNSPAQDYANKPAMAANPTPTPAAEPSVSNSSQISSDGKKKVLLEVTEDRDKSKIYAVATASENDEDKKIIYTKLLGERESISLPFNAWSADNRYLFIQENKKDGPVVMVLNPDGEPFADGETYIDVTDLFKQKQTGNYFDEATGWAEGHLIVINTKLEDKTKGPSYWFEVPSKAIIRLSTQF